MKRLVLSALLLMMCTTLRAESLWVESQSRDLCADRKARGVGDIVTIIITEQATSTQQASTDVSKKTSTGVDAPTGPIIDMLPKVNFSGGDKVSANGSTTRSTNLNARLTAKVTQVLPNGNLVIEGTREVQTNKEKQMMKLSGTIRPDDIAPDNTIYSTYIAEAKITHEGTGPIGDRQKEGIISRILKVIF